MARSVPAPPLCLEAAAPTQLNLLNGFELRHDDRAVNVPTNVARVLAFLALRSRPQHRTTVAGTLWLDSPEERAAANLRTALWKARRVDRDLVVSQGSYLKLGPTVEIDLDAMVARAHQLTEDPTAEIDPATSPDGLSDELLPEWYDDWVLLERERLRQIRLHSLEALCTRLSTLARHGLAIEAGLAAVRAEPLRESAHRAVIRAHLAEGNAGEALRQFDELAKVLRENLGIVPTAATRDLVAALRPA